VDVYLFCTESRQRPSSVADCKIFFEFVVNVPSLPSPFPHCAITLQGVMYIPDGEVFPVFSLLGPSIRSSLTIFSAPWRRFSLSNPPPRNPAFELLSSTRTFCLGYIVTLSPAPLSQTPPPRTTFLVPTPDYTDVVSIRCSEKSWFTQQSPPGPFALEILLNCRRGALHLTLPC